MTIKSNTPAHDKDCWQTPLWLFDALDIEFGFWLDSAASDKNALCAHWLTEADDALNSEWVSHGAIWNNPPYSNIRPSARLWRVSTKFALSLMDGLILSNHRQGWRRRETAKAPCC